MAEPRIALLIAHADAGECDLIVKGQQPRELGFVYRGHDRFQPDRAADQRQCATGQVRAAAPGAAGSGTRAEG